MQDAAGRVARWSKSLWQLCQADNSSRRFGTCVVDYQLLVSLTRVNELACAFARTVKQMYGAEIPGTVAAAVDALEDAVQIAAAAIVGWGALVPGEAKELQRVEVVRFVRLRSAILRLEWTVMDAMERQLTIFDAGAGGKDSESEGVKE